MAEHKHSHGVRSSATALDLAVLEVAMGQDGVITAEQLAGLGMSRRAVAHRCHSGRLHRRHQGVYAVGRPDLTEHGRWRAAVLACRTGAVLSHRSAAVLWGLLQMRHTLVDITVPGFSQHQQPGLWVHRTRVLTPADVTVLHDIPVTSVARTIVDLAGLLDERSLTRAIEQAQRALRCSPEAIAAAMDRVRGRRNLKKLRRILATYQGAPPVRSDFERDFLDLVAQAGLPRPRVNAIVEGLEVDMFWPEWGLIVELDGRGYHSDPRAFENDPIRDARLQRAGYRVLRVTYRRFTDAPAAVLDDIRAVAALARSPAAKRRRRSAARRPSRPPG